MYIDTSQRGSAPIGVAASLNIYLHIKIHLHIPYKQHFEQGCRGFLHAEAKSGSEVLEVVTCTTPSFEKSKSSLQGEYDRKLLQDWPRLKLRGIDGRAPRMLLQALSIGCNG